jgi:hypothetical protein
MRKMRSKAGESVSVLTAFPSSRRDLQMLREKKLQELEDRTRAERFSEAAELAAVIRYFQKWGEMPAGYELIEDDFENSSTARA